VLASFALSHDDDPLVISYESVAPNLTLGPGSYFALFAPQGSDAGSLLVSASDPFNYQAGSIRAGFFDPATGISSAEAHRGAVRVLGVRATPRAAIQLLMTDVRALVSEGELPKGWGKSLLNKLSTSIASLDRDRTTAGCNQLRAFVSQVSGLVRTGRLAIQSGHKLIDAAGRIRTQIKCV
ncbi:MAG TPA: hypothetical protein VD930_10940, partial [Gemmatimonadales bacterium]|nr:hypothetical protein [Gemmatimonadales bacterium]